MSLFWALLRRLFQPYTWGLAWRDSRGQRRRLLLYLSSIAVGVAALVSLQAFWRDVTRAIDQQAKSLLGADLVVRSRGEFPAEIDDYLRKVPAAEFATETRFFNMARFPRHDQTRLVAVRGIEGGFPFYGEIETEPPEAAQRFRSGAPVAILESSLMLQLGIQQGDEMVLGEQRFEVIASLTAMPGETVVMSQFAPRVLIHGDLVQGTGLLRFGSRVFRRRFLKLTSPEQLPAIAEQAKAWEAEHGVAWDTVQTRRAKIGRRLDRLYQFLNLVAFAALLLAGIGIGTAVHVHVRSKIAEIAVLRCLGGTIAQTTAVFVAQAFGLGVLGGLAGAILGSILQLALPAVFGELMPLELTPTFSWQAASLGLAAGVIGTTLFAIPPLIRIRLVSPLAALRPEAGELPKDPWRWPVYGLLVAIVVIAGGLTAPNRLHGFAMSGCLLLAVGLLSLFGWTTLAVVKRLIVRGLPYPIRQGLRNLYRPGNQTLVLILAIGLGSFLLATLHFSQHQILDQLERSDDRNGPNLVLFDIQPHQLEGVEELVSTHNIEINDRVPLVSMRIESINGRSVKELRDANQQLPRGKRVPGWTLRREYRSTYRGALVDSESLSEGTMPNHASLDDGPVPVTIEEGIAEDLKIKLGDSVTFNVQGLQMETVICGVRIVDWYRVQPNFFFVFPNGVLEEAPHSNVLALHAPDVAKSATLQHAVVTAYPTVSAVDLSLIVKSLGGIMDNITFAIRFMAGFSMVTGLLVLSASLWATREERLRESVLLKSVGASRRQILWIMATEFASVGAIAASVGIGQALVATCCLALFVFETPFSAGWASAAVGFLGIVCLTLTIGALQSVQVYRRTALDALRQS